MTHADNKCWWHMPMTHVELLMIHAKEHKAMILVHVEDSCWWHMPMIHVDSDCWRYMHADDTGWWYMLMTHEKMTDANNDTWRWDMPISHGIKTSLLESVNLGVLRFYRPKSIL